VDVLNAVLCEPLTQVLKAGFVVGKDSVAELTLRVDEADVEL
jgi:hypothetical protein